MKPTVLPHFPIFCCALCLALLWIRISRPPWAKLITLTNDTVVRREAGACPSPFSKELRLQRGLLVDERREAAGVRRPRSTASAGDVCM
ncbi:hypothetical protein AX17_002364 [Amanita inopinata Kibby_2008]|nr:hypothetical protein AX17_002364 [Amanita inopinata Kibby_2008]